MTSQVTSLIRKTNRSKFQRTMVLYRTTECWYDCSHTSERYLFVVQPGGRALRYGIGVGRDGFQWRSRANWNGQTGRRHLK